MLGEDTRIGASHLPVDRWMLERLHGSSHGRRRSSLPPVAWHGKFTTTPLAEPDFSATPSPVATPLAPPTVAAPTTRPDDAEIEIDTPATVGALALDVYTRPISPAEEEIEEAPVIAPGPELALAEVAPVIETDGIPTYEVPVVTEPEAAAPTMPRPVPHEELDPDVRALVDELYQQARAELSGNDLAFFAPIDDDEPRPPEADGAPVEPTVDVAPAPTPAPIMNEPGPARAPIAPVAPQATPPTARGGWVPAFTPNERRRRHTTD